MKKYIILISCLLSSFSFAQVGNENVSFSTGNFFMRGNRPSTKEYIVDGNPYINGKQFDKVNINGYSKNVQNLRYNAYEDEMEFQDKNDTFFTNKEEGLKIVFPTLNKTYQTLKYDVDGKYKFGYLVVISENPKYSLYKREKVELLKGEKSPSAYGKDANDYYAKQKDIYLIKTEKGFVKFPKNLKDFTSELGLSKSDVENFVKTNNISFSREADMKKIVEYINSIK